tara:strand:- start:56 stop:736 length:681 start_codon:yes stop_codon:yes gene_type:complete
MKDISDNSIDMVLTDPPYGTTACKWDSVIPLDLMWKELKRVTKKNGAICIFSKNPFTAALIMSNPKMYKYDWIYEKSHATGHLNCKKMPMQKHEMITVFQDKINYYPAVTNKDKKDIRPKTLGDRNTECYGHFKAGDTRTIPINKKYPTSIIKFNKDQKKWHPTQKPVALLEYMLKNYTLESETVLDFTMGSGSTGVACKNLNRKFIGIEMDGKYFEIAKNRIEQA